MIYSRSCHSFLPVSLVFIFFFFNDTATTEIYTLSLHDALPISSPGSTRVGPARTRRWTCPSSPRCARRPAGGCGADRKSTRLNSSHGYISYAVFCLKKKKKNKTKNTTTQKKNKTR